MAEMKNICYILLAFIYFSEVTCEITVSEDDMSLLVGTCGSFNISITEAPTKSFNITISINHGMVATCSPTEITVDPTTKERSWPVLVSANKEGHVIFNVTTSNTSVSSLFVRVTVEKSFELDYISQIIGWIYFFAWSISFYPQIYENYLRKSVIGLNFDFLALNIVGFCLYGLFNAGLYWDLEVEREYFQRHPGGLNPVQMNDIVFAFHAAFACTITIVQCIMYEKGDQRVSTTAKSILFAFFLIFASTLGLAINRNIEWLDFLLYCSYIKLTITLIKYIPQAFMNYSRKSTVGWSIGNVLLDFTGGILSMGQMMINAYNYDDWDSIVGDPTKFGLGLFSVVFDLLFIFQHYFLYRSSTNKVYDLTARV
uniref:Cystinosin homolog n=1 Tax=Clastoptera arizonana TaxID=38151 RepID=A0A1B6DT44_9HEMI